MSTFDARLQKGAYITDGVDLYEVVELRRGPGPMGIQTVRIAAENCRDYRMVDFLPERIKVLFRLVRPAPVPECPDLVEQIVWDAPAHERPLALDRAA